MKDDMVKLHTCGLKR